MTKRTLVETEAERQELRGLVARPALPRPQKIIAAALAALGLALTAAAGVKLWSEHGERAAAGPSSE